MFLERNEEFLFSFIGETISLLLIISVGINVYTFYKQMSKYAENTLFYLLIFMCRMLKTIFELNCTFNIILLAMTDLFDSIN